MTQQRTLVAGSGQPPVGLATSAGHLLQLLRLKPDGYSRAALLELTGMARSTLYERLDALFAAGLVYESTPLTSQRGRPPRPLRFDDRNKLVLGIEVGHTHAGIHIVSLGREILASRRVPIDITQPQENVVSKVIEHSLRLLDGKQPVGAGVGLPAPVDPLHKLGLERTVLAHWDLQRLQEVMEAKLDCPVLLENDARSMAVGEVRGPLESIVAVKVSTGVGSGIIVRGALVRGAHGAAGDIGHVRIPEAAGKRCRCGRDGCLAAVASGRALLADPRFAHYGTLRQLVDAYDEDPEVRAAVANAGRVLGRALSATVGTLNPGRVAVGGLVGVLPEFLAACRQQILDDAFEPSLVDLEIVPADSRTATAVGLCKLVEESLYAPERIEQLLAQRTG
ncbi:transcriptional regulator/sugar kinase [Pseudarthrobacter phenanthrenivorans Sphe3]|uniref:Transcriptional regulator/sugar kinase n=1 Tax=Pseudarthrobacter phenanthrenivorans (strain DSM 18606 / JCM 16027 / LMG 23796 / Sphe3) TaxID=930171 RepID=F0M659_PSEPM|nr:ROK family protein [Pseudarthrobacter phenanthrenivorans]ADX74715.1 transcriptional regulator/sugar kinase [Pseudarthrobacter phenanthrenivorans Sphe3]